MTMILVTHDLAFARHFADEVAVMHDGMLIEQARVEEFFDSPRHPYSRLLLNTLNERINHFNTHPAARA
jgi:ABC-type dipeptide/oligopeptide/nickel transport system ATPase component